MEFEFSACTQEMQRRQLAFMDQYVYPNEHRFHDQVKANWRSDNAWITSGTSASPIRAS